MSVPRARLVPEVIQTSAMDCGPAALAAALQGLGIEVSYPRLRELCQTRVDGTSLGALGEVARRLGVDARRVLLPRERVLGRDEPANTPTPALPAIVPLALEDGAHHFVVVWRREQGGVQVMDPGDGRRWVADEVLERRLLAQETVVPASAWRAWAAGTQGLEQLASLLEGPLALPEAMQEALVVPALEDPDWRALAALHAALRYATALVAGGAPREAVVARVPALVAACRGDPGVVPDPHWPARPEGPDTVRASGVPVLVLRGRIPATAGDGDDGLDAVVAAPVRPWAAVRRSLVAADPSAPRTLAWVAVLLAVAGMVELLLLRGLVDAGALLGGAGGRLGLLAAVLTFFVAIAGVRHGARGLVLRLGRQVEGRLRVALVGHLARLDEAWLRARPASDLAERAHGLGELRALPGWVADAGSTAASLAVTLLALGWMAPVSLAVAGVGAAALVVVVRRAVAASAEPALRAATLDGSLARLALDALLGSAAVRAHGAGPVLQAAAERNLVDLARADRALRVASVRAMGVSGALSTALTAALLVVGPGTLLPVMLALQVPVLVQRLDGVVTAAGPLRARLGRLLEPLGTPAPEPAAPAALPPGPIGVALAGVAVVAGGHPLLRGVDLTVAPGEHVAVVGPSGAGKSSLIGVILGIHAPVAGEARLAGRPLDPAVVAAVRRRTAWVDPAVALWRDTVLANLRYGADEAPADEGQILADARLREAIAGLPDGMLTALGEGGAGLSGGEGQRLRLARAFRRTGVGLAVLDEPFRGLDRPTRRALLGVCRRRWHDATLLVVTHDLEETLAFPRVLVVDDGRIVEDGAPAALVEAGGRFASLLAAERAVRAETWGVAWRRVAVERGEVRS